MKNTKETYKMYNLNSLSLQSLLSLSQEGSGWEGVYLNPWFFNRRFPKRERLFCFKIEVIMNKIEALKYLIEFDVSSDEWSEAGMYHAVKDVIESEEVKFSTEELDILLERAAEF